MKAKIIKTGEIVDIIDYSCDIPRSNFDTVSYIDSKGNKYVNMKMNRILDFEDVKEYDKHIDWEQRRYELIKAAMSGILSGQNVFYCTCSEAKNEIDEKKSTPIAIAKYAIACADCLIKILKENK